MLPVRVSNPGPLTYESGALPIALRGPATTGQCSAVGSASDTKARGPRFDIRSVHNLSSPLPLIQGGQLSGTGESMYT